MTTLPFGLRHRPFRPTPDTHTYCPLDCHEATLAQLQRAFQDNESHAAVFANPGLGKTLIGIRLLDSLPDSAPRVMLNAIPGMKPADLFQTMLFDLAKPYEGLTEHELRLRIQSELLSVLSDNQRLVLLIDEAHNLTPLLLEELRLLGNIESQKVKAIFVVLLGLPKLREMLARPEAAGFAQRLAARCKLEPLTPEVALRYLRHQVRACGAEPEDVFTDEALALLAIHTHGVPRLLNQAASLALNIAQTAAADLVDAEATLESLQQLELIAAESEAERETIPMPEMKRTKRGRRKAG